MDAGSRVTQEAITVGLGGIYFKNICLMCANAQRAADLIAKMKSSIDFQKINFLSSKNSIEDILNFCQEKALKGVHE